MLDNQDTQGSKLIEVLPGRHSGIQDSSAQIGLIRPIEKGDELGDNNGRIEFLAALHHYWPAFWDGLKAATASCSEGELHARFTAWCASLEVVDLWLQDACWQTACLWRQGSTVKFCYFPNGPVIPYFEAFLVDPRPLLKNFVSGESLKMARFRDAMAQPEERESIAQFEKRMIDQFTEQLSCYTKKLRRRIADRPGIKQQADWTALRFQGLRPKQIHERLGGMKRHDNPIEAIRKGVERFAFEIGLTFRTKNREKLSPRQTH